LQRGHKASSLEEGMMEFNLALVGRIFLTGHFPQK